MNKTLDITRRNFLKFAGATTAVAQGQPSSAASMGPTWACMASSLITPQRIRS